MALIQKSNFTKPAPRWFRITDGIISDAENVVITILLLKGITDHDATMIIYKMASEFVRNQLRRFLSNGEEYAPAGTVQTLADVTGQPVETKQNIVLPKDSTLTISDPEKK